MADILGTTALTGTDGNDALRGTNRNDIFTDLGLGFDTVDGLEGNNLLLLDYSSFDSVNGGVVKDKSGSIFAYRVSHANTVDYSQVFFRNIDRLQITGTANDDLLRGGRGKDNFSGRGGNDVLLGNGRADFLKGGTGSDQLTGGGGDDSLSLGRDSDVDTVKYVVGDGSDVIRKFHIGVGGDVINFTGVAAIDVVSIGQGTQLRLSDGIRGNDDFGKGTLLARLVGVQSLTSANVGVNLTSTDGAQFLFS
jgi:Ca2+-binding RTX toxin-like protein